MTRRGESIRIMGFGFHLSLWRLKCPEFGGQRILLVRYSVLLLFSWQAVRLDDELPPWGGETFVRVLLGFNTPVMRVFGSDCRVLLYTQKRWLEPVLLPQIHGLVLMRSCSVHRTAP